MDDEWKRSFDEIKEKHDLAFKTIDVAKKFDSNNNSELAIVNYKISIELIDKALATPVALPDDTDTLDDTWDTALQMIQKMKRTRGELLHRIVQLSPSTSNGKSEETKEKKEEITSTENGSKENKTRPRTFLELAEALQNFEVDTNELPSVLELLLVCENVKIYHIKASGEVTTTDEFSTLRIVRLDQDIERNLEVTYFLQIIRSSTATKIDHKIITSMERSDVNQNKLERCETIESESPRSSPPRLSTDVSIIYPLIPGVSPCFRTDFDAFIFPDLESDEIGGAFGIVIPKVYDEIVLEILEAVLHGVVRQSELGEEEEEEDAEGRSLDDEILRKRARRATSEAISDNIVKGACFVSHGLVKGSEQIGRFMSFATPYLISKMNKAPEGEASVLSKVHQGVEIAKIATNAAAGVTGYVAQKVGNATTALGRFLAPHVHAQGAKLLSNTVGLNSDEASDKVSSCNFCLSYHFKSFIFILF